MTSFKNYSVHSSSVVDPTAIIGERCEVGPFCVIGPDVKLGTAVRLISHVSIVGNTTVGDECVVWPFASIGHEPQDLKYRGEKTKLLIGKRNKIRESVSINPGTEGGGGLTKIGDDCLFMLGSHVGHDCSIGNSVILANNSAIAGHVTIGDNVTIGGLSGIHQFCRIGKGSMIGALSMITNDVLPYTTVVGKRPKLSGLNLIGLKRSGVPQETIHNLRKFYSELFSSKENFKLNAKEILNNGPKNEFESCILDFILSDTSRSFLRPKN